MMAEQSVAHERARRRGARPRRHRASRSPRSRPAPSPPRSGCGATPSSSPTYLPPFTSEDVPAAALALLEPQPLFDPLQAQHHRPPRRRRLGAAAAPSRSCRTPPRAELFVDRRRGRGHRPGAVPRRVLEQGALHRARTGDGPARRRHRAARARGSAPARRGAARRRQHARLPRVHPAGAHRLVRAGRRQRAGRARLRRSPMSTSASPSASRSQTARPSPSRVSNIGIELDGMRLLHLSRGQPRRPGQELRPGGGARPAAVCRARAARIGSEGVQLLGGHGFVKEHPVERWYRDLRAIGVMEGALLV